MPEEHFGQRNMSAKALRWKHAWYVQGTLKGSVGLEWKERE